MSKHISPEEILMIILSVKSYASMYGPNTINENECLSLIEAKIRLGKDQNIAILETLRKLIEKADKEEMKQYMSQYISNQLSNNGKVPLGKKLIEVGEALSVAEEFLDDSFFISLMDKDKRIKDVITKFTKEQMEEIKNGNVDIISPNAFFERCIKAYCKEKGIELPKEKYPQLTMDEEIDLFDKVKEGNEAAQKEFVGRLYRVVLRESLKRHPVIDLPLTETVRHATDGINETLSQYVQGDNIRLTTLSKELINKLIYEAEMNRVHELNINYLSSRFFRGIIEVMESKRTNINSVRLPVYVMNRFEELDKSKVNKAIKEMKGINFQEKGNLSLVLTPPKPQDIFINKAA